MALTALDPMTALIVIDLQVGIVGQPAAHPVCGVVARARALLDAFRRHGLPVVLVNVDGAAPGRTEQPPRSATFPPAWTDLVPELNRQPGDLLVTKQSWGAFATTSLDAQIRARGVTQVVVAGISTSGGVEATARQAYEQGFNVTLAIDAMTDRIAEAHDYSITRVFPRLGETGTTQQIIDLLNTRNP